MGGAGGQHGCVAPHRLGATRPEGRKTLDSPDRAHSPIGPISCQASMSPLQRRALSRQTPGGAGRAVAALRAQCEHLPGCGAAFSRAAAASTKSGTGTPLARAQAIFCSLLMQQQCRQHCAALWQPQGQFSQG